jgi:hypothetical protein
LKQKDECIFSKTENGGGGVVGVQEMVGNAINTLVKFFEKPEFEVSSSYKLYN